MVPVMRPAIVLFVTAALFGAVTTPALAADGSDHVTPDKGTHHYATTDALVPVKDGPANDHDATIDTRLYVPDNATAATPQPAILMTHGFGLNKLSDEVTSAADFLARHGYIV